MTFWIPWAIDALVASVFGYFFFVGLADGSVSSSNLGLWLLILCACVAVIAGSLALRAAAQIRLAQILVTIFAIPSVAAGLFFAALLVIPVRWN